METLKIWVGAVLTLAVWSQLFKENPFYRVAEHATIGITAGHMVVMGYRTFANVGVKPLQEGKYVTIVPILVGLLLIGRLIPQMKNHSRLPMAILVGVGTGVAVRGQIQSNFVGQISATLLPLTSLDNVVIVVGTALTLLMFCFTNTKNPVVREGAKLGRSIAMVAFGAAFANAVMNRVSILLGRVQFLLWDWLKIGM